MAVPDCLDPLGLDQVERGAQPVEVMRGGRAAEILVEHLRVGAVRPVPVARHGTDALARLCRLVGKPHEAKTGGHHQALLAGGDGHVDAPGVHLEPVAGQRGDAIGHQECRVARCVKNVSQRLDIVSNRGGCIHMRGQHGADRMARVGAQRRLDAVKVNCGALAEIENFNLDPLTARHIGPAMAETARGRHQNPLAGGDRVGQRRLPCAVAVADIDGHPACRTGHGAQVGHKARRHLDQCALVDIRRRAVHGAQHLFGHDRWAGDGKIGAAVGKAHGGVSRGGVRARPYAGFGRRQRGRAA